MAALLIAAETQPSGAAPISAPGQLLDLSHWKLVLPVAAAGHTNALTVSPPKLASYVLAPSFALNSARTAVLLRADTSGVVLRPSAYPRSELREVSSTGADALWNSADSNTLTTRQAVTHLPSTGATVTTEVRDGLVDVLQIIADGRGRPSGTATLCVRFLGATQPTCLDSGYVLGTAYDLAISVSAGVVTVSYNNVVKASLAYTGAGLSFRVGTFLQTSTGTGANSYGESAVYALAFTHEPASSGGTGGAGWRPKPGVQWQWQLSSTPTAGELRTAYNAGARAFDIDGDGATAADVSSIHGLSADVGAVCYIDVGGWEDYRSDAATFPASVKGNTMDGWPSERWLDVRQIAILKPLMQARIQMCAAKGFDAVEPDILDGYENSTGFPITGAQQIAYDTMIAGLAHTAGLAVAQKGDVDQTADLEPIFDWTLNEQCGEYRECAALSAYASAGKAVWIVEYTGFPGICATDYPMAGAAAMGKSVNLTANPRTPCLSAKG